MASPKVVARVAGLLYLSASLLFVLALVMRSGIVNASNTTATADNIRASAALFRASIAIELVAWPCFLLAAMTLYVLLQHVHRLAAAAMVIFVAVLVTVGYVNDLNLYTALAIATNANYAHAFGANPPSALVALSLDTQSNGLVISELLWGLWLLPLSYLVIKSGQLPTLVGVLLIVAAASWIGRFVADLLSPGLPYVAVLGQILGVGELVFVAWLLIFGVRLPVVAPPESARAASLGRG